MRIAFVGKKVTDIAYYHNDNEIYDIVINLVRNNIDKKGFNFNCMMRIIRDYFSIKANSPYKDLYNVAYRTTRSEKYKEISEKYFKSIAWNKLDEIGDVELNLSEIKGAGLAACTEYAFLEQNILSFLGFDTYMVGGKILNQNGRKEAHNFNVVRKGDGKFEIIDTAQIARQVLPEISSPEELINLENIEAINGNGNKITYYIGSLKKIGIKL